MNARDKGKRGELDARDFFRSYGYEEAARGQQHMGSADSPDVTGGPPGFHPEVKRTERLLIYDALDQAIRDGRTRSTDGKGKVPFVLHRRNKPRGKSETCRGEWMVVMLASDFMDLVHDALIVRGLK